MKRCSPSRARAIIEEELLRVGCDADSSSAPDHRELREEARDRGWWGKSGSRGEDARTDRNRALLRGYLRIASGDMGLSGGLPLYADGLRLDAKKSVHMDRSVMARLLEAELIEWQDKPPSFVLTTAGEEFVRHDD